MRHAPRSREAGPDIVAAVDLGSNSFHMVVARRHEDDIQVVDRLREMVRLGGGLTGDRRLTAETEERAIACLRRFGQRVADLPPDRIRAVGTNTLRQLRDGGAFLKRAETALGHAIEIIAGREEARLIYLGVAHGLATGPERRLVCDIGGGSTELIVGDGFEPKLMESTHIGCVSMSRRFFPDGRLTAKAMDEAEMAGALEIRPIKHLYREAGWQAAVGSSGTIRAIRSVIEANGWSGSTDEGITREGLARVRESLLAAGHVDRLLLAGLSEERRPVFAGGVAVLRAVFEALGVASMQVSDMALREGVLYDMLGRDRDEDVRQSTVRALARRYEVDTVHAARVEATARALLQQVAGAWNLVEGVYDDLLGWAAQLHEIGLAVSHSRFHKHGAYLVAHADLAGFSRQEQVLLAALILGHRRKIGPKPFSRLPRGTGHDTLRLCVLLRLSALLHRARSPSIDVDARLRVEGDSLRLEFPEGWLDDHPLPRMELRQEAKRLKAVGFRLKCS